MQLLSDLKGIAEQLGVKNYKKLAKQELIYAILDTQASTPEKDLPAKKKAEEKSEKPERPKRVNVKKEKAEKPLRKKEAVDFEKSADELLQSFDLELEAPAVPTDSTASDDKVKQEKKPKKAEHSPRKPSSERDDRPQRKPAERSPRKPNSEHEERGPKKPNADVAAPATDSPKGESDRERPQRRPERVASPEDEARRKEKQERYDERKKVQASIKEFEGAIKSEGV